MEATISLKRTSKPLFMGLPGALRDMLNAKNWRYVSQSVNPKGFYRVPRGGPGQSPVV